MQKHNWRIMAQKPGEKRYMPVSEIDTVNGTVETTDRIIHGIVLWGISQEKATVALWKLQEQFPMINWKLKVTE